MYSSPQWPVPGATHEPGRKPNTSINYARRVLNRFWPCTLRGAALAWGGIDIFALQLLIVAIKSSFSQLPGYSILKTVYSDHWLWSGPYNHGRRGRLSRIMFVPSAVMNNNAAFYYIQRKYLFFTRDKGERDSVHTRIYKSRTGTRHLDWHRIASQRAATTGRKREKRSLPYHNQIAFS